MVQEKTETQTSLHIRNLQETIDNQNMQLDEFKRNRMNEDEKFDHMSQQFELNNAAR